MSAAGLSQGAGALPCMPGGAAGSTMEHPWRSAAKAAPTGFCGTLRRGRGLARAQAPFLGGGSAAATAASVEVVP